MGNHLYPVYEDGVVKIWQEHLDSMQQQAMMQNQMKYKAVPVDVEKYFKESTVDKYKQNLKEWDEWLEEKHRSELSDVRGK